MKKLVVVSLVLSIMCGVSIGYADTRVAVVRNGDIVKLVYKNESLANVKVSISDEKGSAVYSEELISVHGFIRPYNFSELPKGNYTICVIDGNGEDIEKVCYKDKPWLTHMSQLATDENKVMVSVPQQGESEFSVHVYDHNDRLVYSEKQQTNKEYGKVFDLKDLEQGATIHLLNHKTGETKMFLANK